MVFYNKTFLSLKSQHLKSCSEMDDNFINAGEGGINGKVNISRFDFKQGQSRMLFQLVCTQSCQLMRVVIYFTIFIYFWAKCSLWKKGPVVATVNQWNCIHIWLWVVGCGLWVVGCGSWVVGGRGGNTSIHPYIHPHTHTENAIPMSRSPYGCETIKYTDFGVL